MSLRYGQEAIELCRKLYCKYGGKNVDAIEAEMQSVYPGWRRSNLLDRKKHKTDKVPQLGWVNRYAFDKSLEIYTRTLVTGVRNDEQALYIGIKTVRERLEGKVLGEQASKDELYQYRDFCKLEIEARRNLDLSRDNFDTFVSGYELQCRWAPEVNMELAKLLAKHGPRFAELAQAHYGKQQEEAVDDGAEPGEDAGGDEPVSGLRLVG